MDEVYAMHQRRKSFERLEIAAYIHRHNRIDESNCNLVQEEINRLRQAILERKKNMRRYGGKSNTNDVYITVEYQRLCNKLNDMLAVKGRF